MEYQIQNESLCVTVSDCGAEPISIVAGGVERLWCADPAVWGKHAPLLFPLIGRLRNGSYDLDGAPVAAAKHGFCRECQFEVVVSEPQRLVFRTTDGEDTRGMYPFAFELEVEYGLMGNTLVKKHRVANKGNRPMPFELGGHEAYALFGDEWRLDFNAGGSDLQAFGMDEQGFLTFPKWQVPLENGCLVQTPEELSIDTVVLEDLPSKQVTLHQGEGKTVTVDLGTFPFLGVWTMAGVGKERYLCVEPWSALPDGHFMPRELAEKPGVISVAPGETCELAYTMTFA